MPKVTIGKVEYEIDVPYKARREFTNYIQKIRDKPLSIAEQDNKLFEILLLSFTAHPFKNIDEIIDKISMDEFAKIDITFRDIIYPSLKDKTDDEKKS